MGTATQMSHSFSMLVMIGASLAQAPAVASQGPGGSFHPVILREGQLVLDAATLNLAINTAMGSLDQCPTKDLKAALECGCGGKDNLARLASAYREVAARRPDWDRPNVIVSYENTANRHWISLDVSAVNRMLRDCARR